MNLPISQDELSEQTAKTSAEQSDLPEWRSPIITRIEIRKTLNTAGSGGDMGSATTIMP